MDNVPENPGRTARGCRSQSRGHRCSVKAIQPVGVSIRTPGSGAPLCDKTPLTLQKQNSRPALRTPEALLEVEGPWVDQRGEYIVVLSIGRAPAEAEDHLRLRQVGGGEAETILK